MIKLGKRESEREKESERGHFFKCKN